MKSVSERAVLDIVNQYLPEFEADRDFSLNLAKSSVSNQRDVGIKQEYSDWRTRDFFAAHRPRTIDEANFPYENA